MEIPEPKPNFLAPPPPPQKNWIYKHLLLGILFSVLAFAAVVSVIYYWQTTRNLPVNVQLPVHKELIAITECKEITAAGNYLIRESLSNLEYCLRIHDVANVHIRCLKNMSITSDYQTIVFERVKNFSLSDCSVTATKGHFLSMPSPLSISKSEDGNINNNRFFKGSIRIDQSDKITFEGNQSDSA